MYTFCYSKYLFCGKHINRIRHNPDIYLQEIFLDTMSYSKPEQMNDQEFYISVLQGQTAALPCRVQSVPPPTLRLIIFLCYKPAEQHLNLNLISVGSMSTATCYSQCPTTPGSTAWPTCCWWRMPRPVTGASTGQRILYL